MMVFRKAMLNAYLSNKMYYVYLINYMANICI